MAALNIQNFPGENVTLYAASSMELIDEINEAMLQDDQIPDLGTLALMGLANATDLLVNITVGQMLKETKNVMRNDDPMLLLN